MPSTASEAYAFVAYPGSPVSLREPIELAIEATKGRGNNVALVGWPDTDIVGRPLIGPILDEIRASEYLVADVTYLNFNVTYEIGFAIGVGKRVYIVRNNTFRENQNELSRVGIFDTLGYFKYIDSESLSEHLAAITDVTPLPLTYSLNAKAPVYVLETPYRGDAMGRIISLVKKARLQYRSFSPSEDPRMAAIDAIEHVSTSHGVLIPLLSDMMKDSNIHNMRAAFVAGLAHGMEKPALILQDTGGPLPLDVRDAVKSYGRMEDIEGHINDFALDVIQSMQASEPLAETAKSTLAEFSVGDPMAENEFQTLERYFLRRDEYGRTIRGEVNLVVGRKGVGKTALFSQVRNELRRDKQVIVVDLKPEGYQLLKLREQVLDYLTEGARAHLLTAFWEYLLLLEVAYKLLEKDRRRHLYDHAIRDHYRNLYDTYRTSPYSVQGDFSERLLELSSFISDNFGDVTSLTPDNKLTTDKLTELLHQGVLIDLKEALSHYLKFKKGVWILFDNLDKGWSVPGPNKKDILILRCLIDASRKIQRDMQRIGHDFHCIVFIRNDVYQLLMRESADFGKEMRVSLDWSDPELLREMLRLRMVLNGYDSDTSFQRIWTELCVSHIRGEETSQFMVERSLMRPRNLIKIFNHCKGFAVNLSHNKIEPDDVNKGLLSYSNDLLVEADQELATIEPEAEGLIYHFIGEHWKFSRDELLMLFEEHDLSSEKYGDVISFLIYFGFLGIMVGGSDPMYIYDVAYDTKRLDIQVQKHKNRLEYVLNPAFWPALGVGP